jgi:hypothetical protein
MNQATPPQAIFDEIKQAAIAIWSEYDDTDGYASKKIAMVEALTNYRDNWGTIVGMFDAFNQGQLAAMVGPEARAMVVHWAGYPFKP